MLRIIITILIVFNFSYAYKIGDNIDEKTISALKLQKNKTYVLNFFASWCVSCKKELPILSKMTLPKDSEFLLVNVDENIDDGKRFLTDINVSLPTIYDPKSQIISKFNPVGVPAIYFIKDNKVKKALFGAISNIDKKILNDLKEIIK